MSRRLLSFGVGILLALSAVGAVTLRPGLATAAEQPQAGVTVSPALIQLSLSAKQTSYSFTAYVSNASNQYVSFTLSPVNFAPVGDNGGIAYQGATVSSLNNPHGLASFIQTSPASFTLGPRSSQSFKVILSNTNTLSPGGHYGAVLLKLSSSSDLSAANHVAINQVISMLVFTATNGQGTQNVALSKPKVGVAWLHLPRTVDLLASDSGNTQVTPRGYITVWSSSHKPLSRTILNSGSALVLPGSTRLFKSTVGVTHQPTWPGIYSLEVAYTNTGTGHLAYFHVNIIFFGRAIFVILGLLILLFAGWQYKRSIRLRKYRLTR